MNTNFFKLWILVSILFLLVFVRAEGGSGQYYDSDVGGWVDCPPGYYCDGTGDKVPCEDNEYAEGTAFECTECPSSTVQNYNQSGCDFCDSKQYINTTVSPRICDTCTGGYYCNGVSITQCESGFYCTGGEREACDDYQVAPVESTSCSTCDYENGLFPNGARSSCVTCSSNFYGTPTGCVICSIGYYCNGVSRSPCDPYEVAEEGSTSCDTCVSPEFPNSDLSACTTCGSDEYGDGTGCNSCSAGYSCDGINRTQCIGNTYSIEGDAECHSCPAHSYTNTNKDTCVECVSTEWDNTTLGQCETCPAGYYCNGISKTQCTGNTYSEDGATSCIPCLTNSYTNADFTECIPCEDPKEYDDTTQCLPCPVGHSCDGTYTPDPCDAGYVSDIGVGVCTECIDDTFMDDDQSECISCDDPNQYGIVEQGCLACPAGYECDGVSKTLCTGNTISALGVGVCSACDSGEYTDDHVSCESCNDPKEYDTGSYPTGCQPCPAGFECDGSESMTECSDGYFALEGVGVCSPCNNGMYGMVDHTDCNNCPTGTATPATGAYDEVSDCDPCDAGYFSKDGSPCTACDTGLTNATKSDCRTVCAAGTYLSPSGCNPCPSGYWCMYDVMIPCTGNSYSTGNASECSLCVTGFVNSAHTSCNVSLCSSGEYFVPYEPSTTITPSTDPDSINGQCLPCPRGSVCSNGRLFNLGLGDYTDLDVYTTDLWGSTATSCSGTVVDGKTACRVCTVAGEYYDHQTSQCLSCPPGYACPSGQNELVECALSTMYQPLSGQSSCLTCSTGLVSTDGIQCMKCPNGMYPNIVTRTCVPCPMGYRCNGASQPVACSGTEYQPYSGRSACLTCLSPGIVDKTNTACTNCDAGEFYNATLERCIKCPAGYSCINNSAYRCDENTYAKPGSSSCSDCYSTTDTSVRGFISADQTSCIVCSDGDYVDRYTEDCAICPKGHYCPDGVNIYPCFGGFETETGTYYEDSYGRVQCDGDCLEPSYIAANGTICAECDDGEYIADSLDCEPCPSGYYCKNSRRFRCPPRTYSPGGYSDRCYSCDNGLTDDLRSLCEPCPEGEYMDAPGGVAKCVTCPSGSFCTNGYKTTCASQSWSNAGEKKCLKCPGGVIPSSKTSCTTCDDGLYPNIEQTKCLTCPSGFYCVGGTIYECLDSFYAPEGSSKCFYCSGYVSDDGSECLTGISAYASQASTSISNGDFWSIGVLWCILFVICFIIHSCVFGCMCWPKKLINKDWALKEKADKTKKVERDKKRNEASKAASQAFEKAQIRKKGAKKDLKTSISDGDMDSVELTTTKKPTDLASKRAAAIGNIRGRRGMRGPSRVSTRGSSRGAPSLATRRSIRAQR